MKTLEYSQTSPRDFVFYTYMQKHLNSFEFIFDVSAGYVVFRHCLLPKFVEFRAKLVCFYNQIETSRKSSYTSNVHLFQTSDPVKIKVQWYLYLLQCQDFLLFVNKRQECFRKTE